MSVINPVKVPRVALDFMNHDHREATDLINSLAELIEQSRASGTPVLELDTKLEELLEHNRTHFAQEEERMRAAGFPPYPMHKGEHERVLREMQEMHDHWIQERDLDALAVYVNETLPKWFINHISTMDFVTARFISSHGG